MSFIGSVRLDEQCFTPQMHTLDLTLRMVYFCSRPWVGGSNAVNIYKIGDV